MEPELKLGKYRHYKGSINEVIGVARHSETEELLVVYRHLDGVSDALWARPLAMFTEKFIFEGREVPRFEYLGD